MANFEPGLYAIKTSTQDFRGVCIIHDHDILIVLDLCPAIHNFPLVSRSSDEIQENRSVPDLCEIKECLSNMFT